MSWALRCWRPRRNWVNSIKNGRFRRIDPARVAAHDDTSLYFACPDVDAADEELRRKGAAVTSPKVMRYGMKQIDVRDPDGFLLCFQCPIE